MANRLLETTIGEVCQVFDGPHATPTRLDAGPVFLGITSLNKGRIDLAASDHVSEEDFSKWTRRVTPKPGDVVFSYETKLGEAAIIPEGLRCCLGRRMGLMRPDPNKLDSRFLLYYYLGPEFQDVIRERTIRGSTVERIALIEFPRFPLRIPPLHQQRAIARALGALDDKIELNRRMNATLEAMARALFQSWFVDFDPVRAKLDNRQPIGLDKATAELFPAAYQDSALGPIPEDWEVCSLANKFELLSGGTPKTSEPDYWDGDIPWYSVKDAPSETDVWVIQTEKCVTKLGIANSAAQILPSGTTIISARGTVGKLALVGAPMAMNQSCYGVRGIKGYGDFFTYFALRQATAELRQRTHGTVFDTITRQTFETLDCVFPPGRLTQAFDRTVAPLLAQIRANVHQSRNLATLRDILLPKLLSGEITI